LTYADPAGAFLRHLQHWRGRKGEVRRRSSGLLRSQLQQSPRFLSETLAAQVCFNRRAARNSIGKRLCPSPCVVLVPTHVWQPSRRCDHIRHRCAFQGEHGGNVLVNLCRLHVAVTIADEIAIWSVGDHPARVNGVTRSDPRRKPALLYPTPPRVQPLLSDELYAPLVCLPE